MPRIKGWVKVNRRLWKLGNLLEATISGATSWSRGYYHILIKEVKTKSVLGKDKFLRFEDAEKELKVMMKKISNRLYGGEK